MHTGDSLEKGMCKRKAEQTLQDFSKKVRAINRYMKIRAVREGWEYKVFIAISRKSLSDKKNKQEYPKGFNDKYTSYHVHLFFYSPKNDKQELLHIANCYRWQWVKKYGLGGDNCNLNAEYCDVARFYYVNAQCESVICQSDGGAVHVNDFRMMIKNIVDELPEYDKHIVFTRRCKWEERSWIIDNVNNDN